MSGWCHKCGYQMCVCEFNEKRPSVAKMQAENESLTARLAEAEAERDDTRAWIRAYYQQWDVKSPTAAALRKRFHWLVEA